MLSSLVSKSKLDSLYLPCLEAISGTSQKVDNPSVPGHYWELSEKKGKGYYWYFPIDDIMAVNIADLEFSSNLTLSYEVPDFFCLGKYNHNMAAYFFEPDKNHHSPSDPGAKILGYAWRGSFFTGTIRAGERMQVTGITLLPEAVARLGSRFAGDPYILASALSELDGNQVVPGLDELFDVLFDVRPGVFGASLFYESKIAEAAALLIDWWHQKQESTSTYLRPLDRTALNITIDYILNHFSEPLSLDLLCRIACMSASKLAKLFKMTENQTPMEYVRNVRLEHACKMLSSSDSPLSEIARELGFTHQGSFSEAFKTHYGTTPLSYRKTHSRQH